MLIKLIKTVPKVFKMNKGIVEKEITARITHEILKEAKE
jgi:hypothetical protein